MNGFTGRCDTAEELIDEMTSVSKERIQILAQEKQKMENTEHINKACKERVKCMCDLNPRRVEIMRQKTRLER